MNESLDDQVQKSFSNAFYVLNSFSDNDLYNFKWTNERTHFQESLHLFQNHF